MADRLRITQEHARAAVEQSTPNALDACPAAASRVETLTQGELQQNMFEYECKLREDASLSQWQVFEALEARTRRATGSIKMSATNVLRTPDTCFADLRDWSYEPEYFVSGLYGMEVRMAYYDIGPKDAQETVLVTHGEPSWSYVNRRLIPKFLAQGYRVVAFDQVGFGRSDKPVKEEDYTYERHIGWNVDLLVNHLALSGITAVFQDWGGVIGLRVAAAHPARFKRLVISNTFLPTDEEGFCVKDGFLNWKALAWKTKLADAVMPVGQLLATAARGPSNGLKLSEEEIAAYNAPFPDEAYKAGVRRFPELVPTPPSDKTGRPQPLEVENNKAAWAVFKAWHKPVLTAFGNRDNVMRGFEEVWHMHCPGARNHAHVEIEDAGHFVQDGGGEQLAATVIAFVDKTADMSPTASL